MEFIKRRSSNELSLTSFARAYQSGMPVAPGIEILFDNGTYFLLTRKQAMELSDALLLPYDNPEQVKMIEK